MARTHFWQFLLNKEGQPIPDAEVNIYEAGTTTPARVFDGEFGDTYTSIIPQILTNSKGYFEFWVADDEEVAGYPASQKFRIEWSKSGIETGMVDWVDILDFVSYPVDETDAANVVKNKLVSNYLAYRWNSHTARSIENQVVHGLTAVDPTSQDTAYNKVVSNKTIYDIVNESAISNALLRDGTVDATGVLSYDINVNVSDFINDRNIVTKEYVDNSIAGATGGIVESRHDLVSTDWSVDAASDNYRVILSHSLDINYPTVTMWYTGTIPHKIVSPSDVQRIDSNSLIIYHTDNISAHIRIF